MTRRYFVVKTSILNTYLNEVMEGLSAKVFRTYNASRTLQDQLDKVTNGKKLIHIFETFSHRQMNVFSFKIAKDNINEKLLAYNRSNRAVAILCNHQRAVPKTFEKSMENMKEKVNVFSADKHHISTINLYVILLKDPSQKRPNSRRRKRT